MILFVRKSSVVLLGIILSLSFVLLAVTGAMAQSEKTDLFTVLVDAGHGAPDGGCVAADGTQEAPLNLAVSLKLKTALEKQGVRVLLTRADENGIHDSGESIGEKKRSDMRRRKAMRDASDAELFVSIHMNQFSQTQYHGAQVIYDTTNPEAQQVALNIQNAIRNRLDSENKRVPMAAPSTVYLMRAPKVASVIVECGFLSNEAEREKLKTDAYQQRLADAIAEGIVQYQKGHKTSGETTELVR
ncbi:MAG: N-acetylmuramoyl-L-alanine amidase [Clostridia bacterium]|nr:N-acetylmuramoyl-L-alanine amidase [Clostridia bacterium]